MSRSFDPHLEVLQPAQRQLWDQMRNVPEQFVLCGGTAVALHLGHRVSVDFDLFGSEPFDPDQLRRAVPILQDAEVLQASPSTLTCLIDCGELVQVSFFGVPELGRIERPWVAEDNSLKVAALIDLAGLKAAVVQKRAEAKDYLDVDAIIHRGEIGLPTVLAAGRAIYGRSFNPQNTLKALAFYDDGNLDQVPSDVRQRLLAAVASIDLDDLPRLEAMANREPED